jgi:hypothetical protein
MDANENANGGLGTVIIYTGGLSDYARKRRAVCRNGDQPVFAINMDLFKRKRDVVRRDFVSWSINHLIADLSFCTQKGELFKKSYGKFYWVKAAARDCKRALRMAQEFPNSCK